MTLIHQLVAMSFASPPTVLRRMDDPSNLPLSKRFERKITEEIRSKQADIEARKSEAAEDRRRHDLQTISGLELTTIRRSSNKEETGSQSTQRRNAKNQSDLPELDTRHTAPLPVKPGSLPSPPLSGISQVPPSKPESRYTRPRSESELISQLQAELSHQQNYSERLEKDLASTKHRLERLRAEYDEAEQEHLEAIRQNDKEPTANLDERVSQLARMVEDARKRVRELENEVDEGRSRVRDLRDQLDEARREKVGLMHEIQILKSPRSPESTPGFDSHPKDIKAKRAPSGRGGSKREKKKHEFSVRKGERHSSATLFTSVVKSFA